MLKKTFTTFILITLAAVMTPLLTPTALAQAGEASSTLEITDCPIACTLTLTITSPVDVAEYQISIKTSSSVNLETGMATLTGFMTGSSHLSQKGVEIDEYRWFNLQSEGGRVGTLTIPISNIGGEIAVYLDRADLLDADGDRIEVAGLPQGAVLISTSTVTTTTTRTSTSTITTTTTSTATSTRTTTITTRVTSTTTRTSISTSTSTSTTTTTSTSVTTSTATTTTTKSTTQTSIATSTTTSTATAATTTTVTTEVAGGGLTWMVTAAVLAVITIVLLAMIIRERQKA